MADEKRARQGKVEAAYLAVSRGQEASTCGNGVLKRGGKRRN